ncbi:CBM96 family carbohydrate-binding protein [Actinomadura madurae]|uniref:CBM96 family carbohydrate-binding protein n=1 Tax=Actinomadura madurae TaxID=1993 RepID=UPI0020D21414|nr:hypothetical protein [Actinomadura madurae]MCP9967066.1 hypothetical protein [Actinomadura madurae]
MRHHERHHRPDARRSSPVPPRRARRRGPRPSFYFTAAGTLLVVGGSAAAVALSGAAVSRDARTAAAGASTVVPASADTYVVREMPGKGFGGARKITASVWPAWHTEAYVAFDVPRGTPRVTRARVELTFDRAENRPRRVELRALPGAWTEDGTSWRNRPVAGAVVATAAAGRRHGVLRRRLPGARPRPLRVRHHQPGHPIGGLGALPGKRQRPPPRPAHPARRGGPVPDHGTVRLLHEPPRARSGTHLGRSGAREDPEDVPGRRQDALRPLPRTPTG